MPHWVWGPACIVLHSSTHSHPHSFLESRRARPARECRMWELSIVPWTLGNTFQRYIKYNGVDWRQCVLKCKMMPVLFMYQCVVRTPNRKQCDVFSHQFPSHNKLLSYGRFDVAWSTYDVTVITGYDIHDITATFHFWIYSVAFCLFREVTTQHYDCLRLIARYCTVTQSLALSNPQGDITDTGPLFTKR